MKKTSPFFPERCLLTIACLGLFAMPVTAQTTREQAPGATKENGRAVIYGNADSAYVTKMYGSIKEYNAQYLMKQQSSHGHLVMFAGTGAAWVNEMVNYLEERRWQVDIGGSGGGKDFTRIALLGPCDGCEAKDRPRMVIRQQINPATRCTQNIVLTGNGLTMEHFFVAFWSMAATHIAEARTKGIFYHTLLSDKITLEWKPAGSEIRITSNPQVKVAGRN
ncbi:hypothetical protein [Chitinophaga nivalis]|uniref:Uncharacterized protein n=1 Tax=Chitinophaga nivalis TaxID=2991709 RepID=A0ABT3IIQ5_9BACT|nr:hypothetical protein [Chitinophaga nivalis]MCW3466473.1 hypothetical protein [Chitinophaga nivalis]MCW3483836.1 hypothetical protein [Chitinophaga nivalis]